MITNAELSRYVARTALIVVHAQYELAQGAWNKDFNAAECEHRARDFVESLRTKADEIEGRIRGWRCVKDGSER